MGRALLLVAVLVAGIVILGKVSGSRARIEKRVSVGSTPPGAPTSTPPSRVSLDDGWRYLADPQDVGLARGWGLGGAPVAGWKQVTMPNDFNPGVTSSADRGRVGWYELRFLAPPQTRDRSWAVHFESVRRNATVWLNGELIGHNADPYAPFSLPARSLVPRRINTLIVRVDNFRGPGSFPEDWWNWGGIMGPVSLQPVGRLELEDLGVLPELGCHFACGDLRVEGIIVSHSSARLRPEVLVRVSDPSGRVVAVRKHQLNTTGRFGFRVPIPAPLALWSPSDPALYTVSVQLRTGARVEQVQQLQSGLRSVRVARGLLYLNGRRLWLHGASIHEDMTGDGAALNDSDIDTIVSELRSVGANITRAHYLLSERFLDALDQAGIMVWEQPPVDHADPILATADGRRRALSMLGSTILGDRSHPSAIINSVGNELSPNADHSPGTLSYLQQAIPLARALDPAAAVALDTYCYPGFPKQRIYSKLDVLGISSYFGWYTGRPGHSIADFNQLTPFLRMTHSRYPAQALAVSEYGAEGVYDGDSSVKGSYEFQSDYLRRTLNVINSLPFLNGSIYWTLREFAVAPGWRGGAELPPGAQPDGIHHKGLISYDGTPKSAYTLAEQLFETVPSFAR
jgi:beta-glucuronidase